MRRWQLQEAKARLSEVVKSTEREGPQEITVRGRAAAVVVSAPEYRRLRGTKPTFLAFLRGSPLRGARLEVRRDRSPARDVKI